MELSDLLARFDNPTEAAKIAGMGRTAAYHWYAPIERMILPSVEVVVRLADHASLTDEQLGQVIRSRSRLRKYLHQLGEKKRQEQKRQKRAEAVSRNREAIRERLLARQQKKDEMVAREVEIEEKENYLIEQERLRDERERLERLEKILEKGLSQ
jgi:transposase|tara:strand:+ start:250 stop:714 length:465 start_codon:yes stop_codon:yes gene_type:complete